MTAPLFSTRLLVTLTVDVTDEPKDTQYAAAMDLMRLHFPEAESFAWKGETQDGPHMVYTFEVGE